MRKRNGKTLLLDALIVILALAVGVMLYSVYRSNKSTDEKTAAVSPAVTTAQPTEAPAGEPTEEPTPEPTDDLDGSLKIGRAHV